MAAKTCEVKTELIGVAAVEPDDDVPATEGPMARVSFLVSIEDARKLAWFMYIKAATLTIAEPASMNPATMPKGGEP